MFHVLKYEFHNCSRDGRVVVRFRSQTRSFSGVTVWLVSVPALDGVAEAETFSSHNLEDAPSLPPSLPG